MNQLSSLLDPEVWVVTSAHNKRRGGLIATFVNTASIVVEMPRVVIGIAKHHHTSDLIAESRSFAVHLIGEHQLQWVWRFGLQRGREVDKFADLTVDTENTGSPLLTDALGWMECRVENEMDIGDRTVFLGEVVDTVLQRTEKPLTIQRVLALAPNDKLQTMKSLQQADANVDAEAIRKWRENPPAG